MLVFRSVLETGDLFGLFSFRTLDQEVLFQQPMTSIVTIIDCGTGNLNSVKRSLDILGITPKVSSDPLDIADAEKIILPGVGHFGKAMANLKRLNLIEPLEQAVLIDRRPILGICLGMELMAKKSEEGNALGLGWIDAEIVRFNISNTERYKVPHIGWNQIKINRSSPLLKDVPDGSEFYFLHSFHLKINDPSVVISESRYEVKFASSIQKENIFGVQYHPEKSHDVGLQILKNFIEM